MILKRMNEKEFNFQKFEDIIVAMRNLLDHPGDSAVTLEDLLAFQDEDGSFKLFDSYKVPSDARVDFCHMPTYIGSAILMRELLSGRNDLTAQLERALKASLHVKLSGHGYDGEKGRVDAMNVFITGNLRAFLNDRRELCPEFHEMIHNILHNYRAALLSREPRETSGAWGEDYREQWQNIVDNLKPNKRVYVAYGSNMDRDQMIERCPKAVFIGTTYIEGWRLTMPFYANIEPAKGKRTPALVWDIGIDEISGLDCYEGYPKKYTKKDIVVSVKGSRVSSMAYVMTNEYNKNTGIKVRENYEEQIKQAYAEHFPGEKFQPLRSRP